MVDYTVGRSDCRQPFLFAMKSPFQDRCQNFPMKSPKNSKPQRRTSPPQPPKAQEWVIYEAEILEGLRSFASNELNNRFKYDIDIQTSTVDSFVFKFRGNPDEFARLQTVVAIYNVIQFEVPRPKALLGHQLLTRLIAHIKDVIKTSPKEFHTFRFSAAGKDSVVFGRLAEEIQNATGLTHTPDEGDLLIRVRPSEIYSSGWEILTRTTPRPIATRSWRVCDMRGALNGTIAAAMVEMSFPENGDVFVNMMSGSGTLMIERLIRRPAKVVIGIEHDPRAIECARKNISAAHMTNSIELLQQDASKTELPDRSADAIVADLPWGQQVGTHEYNETLYPKILKEAARIAKPGARFVILSHEVNLMEKIIETQAAWWDVKRTVKVFQGGLHPRLFALERTSQPLKD